MLNRLIILANGEIDDLSFYRNIIGDKDFIICADGGSYLAYLLGITPNMIIGDADSVDKNIIKRFKAVNQDLIFKQYPKNKDKSDLELALDTAVLLKPSAIIILAALGKRIDHELINIFLLLGRKDYIHKIKIISQNSELFILDKKAVIAGKKGFTLTLAPLTNIVKNVTTAGLKYELKNKNLTWGSSLTLSNVIMKKEAKIEYDGGILLAIMCKSYEK